ncbi:hypothetical protein Y032_0365g3573 [Ancylostoma ceylanicum]|uniref:Uncharacterized protein n=1 Tax=Ancylostoma ceylanicum TaxID=53326 RepID=A0A016RUZ9_9BILA|nr:hypothetical protein Y032_0365g3573 [Ancylostoma ceylanicum]
MIRIDRHVTSSWIAGKRSSSPLSSGVSSFYFIPHFIHVATAGGRGEVWGHCMIQNVVSTDQDVSFIFC